MCDKLESKTWNESTSSAVDSRVRISVTLGKVLDWLVHALGSGSSSRASLANWNPNSLSWRTSQRSLVGDWEQYSGRFPTSGMMLSGSIFALPTLAHRTGERDCSSWPTPRCQDMLHSGRLDGAEAKRHTPSLAVLVQPRWPTPTSTGSKNSGAASCSTKSGRHSGTTLTDAAVRRTWATPTSSENSNRTQKMAPSHGKTHGVVLGGQVGGKLNPAWVENLMGLPHGWTDTGGQEDLTSRKENGKRLARSKKAVQKERNG